MYSWGLLLSSSCVSVSPIDFMRFQCIIIEEGGGGELELEDYLVMLSGFPHTSKSRLCPHGSLWAFSLHPDSTFRNRTQNLRLVEWFFGAPSVADQPRCGWPKTVKTQGRKAKEGEVHGNKRLWFHMALRRSCWFGDLTSRTDYYASNLRWCSDFCKNQECPTCCRAIKTPRFSKLFFTSPTSDNTYSKALLKATKSESVNVDPGICIFKLLGDSRIWKAFSGVAGIKLRLRKTRGDLNPKDFLLETASWLCLWPDPSRPEQISFSENSVDPESRSSWLGELFKITHTLPIPRGADWVGRDLSIDIYFFKLHRSYSQSEDSWARQAYDFTYLV